MALDRIVVVGASLAGLRASEALRRAGYECDLIIVGAERHRPYDRPPLSKELLAGKVDQTAFRVDDEALAATWRLGKPATGLDLGRRAVVLAGGEHLPFDGLVIATGAGARPWPAFPLPDRDDIFMLRELDDALALRQALMAARHVVVLGAGFIGCEVAATARQLGREVALVDIAPHPMGPLGPEVGAVCAELHRARGVDLRLGATVAAVEDGRVLLQDGAALRADLVLVATGAMPRTQWLEGSGLALAPGVVCDAFCAAVGAEGVYAAGDVAQWPHPLAAGELVRIEHWSNAAEQGMVAARNLLGERIPYAPVPSFWSDQYDVKVQAVGFPHRGDHSHVAEGSLQDGRFAMAFGRRGRLVGAVLWNMPRRMPHYRRWVGDRRPMQALRTQVP